MSHVTRAVRLLSTLHANKTAVQGGRKTADDIAKETVFSPEFFPAFLACSMVASGFAGWNFMESRRVKTQRTFESSYPKVVYDESSPPLDPRFRGE